MIICIGREFGSGGHEIGRILAKKLKKKLDIIIKLKSERYESNILHLCPRQRR